jgi:hypothetical protein
MLVVQGYQHYISSNITFMGVQDLDKIRLVDLNILGWLWHGLSHFSTC